jgi:hypothetical protein
MAQNKTVPTNASVDKFVAGVENKRRRADALVLLQILGEVTGLVPKMWGPSIIGYGEYHYKYESGREGDFLAIGFSPRKASLSVYVGTKFDGADELYSSLGKHKRSKACLYINKLDDVDPDVLREILKRDFEWTLANQHCSAC